MPSWDVREFRYSSFYRRGRTAEVVGLTTVAVFAWLTGDRSRFPMEALLVALAIWSVVRSRKTYVRTSLDHIAITESTVLPSRRIQWTLIRKAERVGLSLIELTPLAGRPATLRLDHLESADCAELVATLERRLGPLELRPPRPPVVLPTNDMPSGLPAGPFLAALDSLAASRRRGELAEKDFEQAKAALIEERRAAARRRYTEDSG